MPSIETLPERVENVPYHFVPIRAYPQGVGHKVRAHFALVDAFVQKRRGTWSGDFGNSVILSTSRRNGSRESVEEQGASLPGS
jgi:hypothetical protein